MINIHAQLFDLQNTSTTWREHSVHRSTLRTVLILRTIIHFDEFIIISEMLFFQFKVYRWTLCYRFQCVDSDNI